MASPQPRGYVLKNGEGVYMDFQGTKMTVKVSGKQPDAEYSLIEMIHPPNIGPALHIHPKGPEAFYVLEGSYRIHCDQANYDAHPGDFVYIPTGITHNYQSGSVEEKS